ncbi:MAG: hypothetical protein N2167_03135 [Flavobacteriales bacterium]|nr:hypothetical protein [Flavobacteriales bacterium]
MKIKASAIFILIILSVPMLSKLGLWVYFISNRKEIAKTLCVNKDIPDSCCKGKCYLGSQLKKVDDPSQDTKQVPPLSIKLKEFAAELIIQENPFGFYEEIKIIIWPDINFKLLQPNLLPFFHPPEV